MNIVLISCDTLRADRLGCYGYDPPVSPYIDEIAREGVVFDNAFGADLPTEPVHTALFTGKLGIHTGIVAHGAHSRYLSKSEPWLPEILWRSGYRTAACDNLYMLKEWFARGFSDYLNTVSRSRFIDGRDVNARAGDWLRAYKDKSNKKKEPFFLFLHYWDTHTPYLPPESYVKMFYDDDPFSRHHHGMEPVREQLLYPFFHEYHYKHLGPVTDPKYINALYEAEVRYLDERLREFDQTLDRLGLMDDTLLIIMGDHGESMDEHDIYWDHAGLYEATVKVPLIMRWPNRIKPATRFNGMVQHVDIMPTILEAAGLDAFGARRSERSADGLAFDYSGDGQSLWPLIEDGAASRHTRIYHSECNWQASRAIRTNEWKLIQNIDPWAYDRPEWELYHVGRDPAETNNLADQEKTTLAALRSELDHWVREKLSGSVDPITDTLSTVGMPAEARLNRTLATWNLTWNEWVSNPDLAKLNLEYKLFPRKLE